jgi:tetrahedral aminopeptidase
MKLLKKLSEAYGASGYEDEIREIVSKELKPLCNKVEIDTMGSVVGFKEGKAKKDKKKIMLAGHIDEIGFLVSHVNDKGFIRISPAGGFDPRTLMAQRVMVLGMGKHKLPGLLNVAGKPIHVQSADERKKELQVSDFYVDLGLPGDEVKKKVEIGDPVIWSRDFIEMGDCVTGKALDDRAGVYMMIEALRKVKNNSNDIYAVGTVQEEVGLRGATTCAFNVDPDIAIALDVTLAIDTPGSEEHGAISQLGKGIAIKIMDSASISDRGLVTEFRQLAEKNKIAYQLEILPRGGTDAGAMQRACSGARAITLSIPIRNVHSVNECANKGDIEAGINLLAKYLSQ